MGKPAPSAPPTSSSAPSAADAYARVVTKKFTFKGGAALTARAEDKAKKRAKKEAKKAKKRDGADREATTTGGTKSYEDEFPEEARRATEGRGRTVACGTNYRAAPETLHGYSRKWRDTPASAMTREEKLDLRSATKADKFCK